MSNSRGRRARGRGGRGGGGNDRGGQRGGPHQEQQGHGVAGHQQAPPPIPPSLGDFPELPPPIRPSVAPPNAWGLRPALRVPGPESSTTGLLSVAVQVMAPAQITPSAAPVQVNVPSAGLAMTSKATKDEALAEPTASLTSTAGKGQESSKIMAIRRPPNGYGVYKNHIQVIVNHYGIRFKDGQTIHRYSVALSAKANERPLPTPLRAGLKRQIMTQFRLANPDSVLGDGRGQEIAFNKADEIFTGKPLVAVGSEPKSFNVTVKTEGDLREYECVVTLSNPLVLQASHLVQTILSQNKGNVEDRIRPIDTILRQAFLNSQRTVEIGRSLYVPSSNFELPEGLQGITKLFATVRPSGLAEQLAIVINISAGVFYKVQSVLDYLRDRGFSREIPPTDHPDAKSFRFNEKQVQIVQKYLSGLRVTYPVQDPTGKSYEGSKIIYGLTREGAYRQTFSLVEERRQVTVKQYYFEKYGKTLYYEQLQCLQVSADLQRSVYIPMELCSVKKNQQLRDQIAPHVLQQMIKICALPAPRRMQMSREERDALQNQRSGNAVLDGFGLIVSPQMARIEAHLIPFPQVVQAGPVKVREGQSSWQTDERQLESPKPLSKWMLVVLETQINEGQFIKNLQTAGRRFGMSIADPIHCNSTLLVSEIKNLMEKLPSAAQEMQMIIFIIGKFASGHIYDTIKQVLELSGNGIRSQVIKEKTASSKRYMANILRKINVKLGGVNHIFKRPVFLKEKRVMVIGADVTHPNGAGLKTRPSLVAVVGSMDQQLVSYRAEISAQVNPGGRLKETITDFEGLVDKLFQSFSGVPEVIFYYRDGVSEGQYVQVLTEEYNAMVRAYKARYNREPKITFIVVTKRHQTRMECANSRDSVGSAQNVPPGTVADKGLCSVDFYDWYLVSHFGIQGTSRPAHYIVLWDENGFSATELQEFSHCLTFGYARCTRSVSLPIPVYYAHHAAFRAREHLGKEMFPGLGGSDEDARRELARIRPLITPTNAIKDGGMYFL